VLLYASEHFRGCLLADVRLIDASRRGGLAALAVGWALRSDFFSGVKHLTRFSLLPELL
jgi:hypothetical protein